MNLLFGLFVLVLILELCLNEYLLRKNSSIQEKEELIKLRNKRDKTYEEQLQFIKLNEKYKKYISFSAVGIAKMILFILILAFFPKYTTLIFAIIITYKIIRIILDKKDILLNIASTILNFSVLYLLFKLMASMHILLILLIVFIVTFVFNIVKIKVQK